MWSVLARCAGVIALLTAWTGQALAWGVRTAPESVVYVYTVNQGRNLFDGVIHALAIRNDRDETVKVESVRVDARENGETIQTWNIALSNLEQTTRQAAVLRERGDLEKVEVYFHTLAMVGRDAEPEASLVLKPGQYAMTMSHYMAFARIPEELRIRVSGAGPDGTPVVAEKTLTVEQYATKNTYILPIAGTAMVAAAAGARTNHRWSLAAEFALDFDALSGDTSRYQSNRSDPEEFVVFGRSVLAGADGTVVETVSDQPDSLDFLCQPEENIEACSRRINDLNRTWTREQPNALCGNRVVIDHGSDEFSLSCHLKQDSVLVSVGEKVVQGQVIGQVGNSGNGSAPHLHFQLSDGPDQFTSRSLPVTFSNAYADWGGSLKGKHLLTGDIVSATE